MKNVNIIIFNSLFLKILIQNISNKNLNYARSDVEDGERAVVHRPAHELAVPLVGGADVLDRRPVREVGEEVRNGVVVDV